MTAYFISFDNRTLEYANAVSGSAVAKAAEFLDDLAKRSGLKGLNDYFSMDPEEARAFLEDEGMPTDGFTPPAEVFFDAEEGIQWATAMIALVEREQHPRQAKILADLADFRAVFTKAKVAGLRWHFSIDI